MLDLVQPQLDRLAEQISSTLGQAQGEFREMDRLMERWEVRAEGRFAGLESRLAVLSDGAARTEHRERDLNERIAGFAEDFLRRNSTTGSHEPEATLMLPRLHDLEQRLHEATTRIDRTEETLRKSTKSVRRLEDCFADLEASARDHDLSQLQEQLEELWQQKEAELRDRELVKEYLKRLEHLEEEVCSLNFASAQAQPSQAALCGQVDQQRCDIEVMSGRFEDRCRELQTQADDLRRRLNEQQGTLTKTGSDQQQALGARVDDLNVRLGALKVKSDSLEGRIGSFCDGTRGKVPEDLQRQLADSCSKLVAEADQRMEVVEQRLDALSENCEEAVEQALERRLAVLAGALPPSSSASSRQGLSSRSNGLSRLAGRPRSRAPSPSCGFGTPSRPDACGDLRGDLDDIFVGD